MAAAYTNLEQSPTGTESSDLPSFLVVGPPRTGTTWLHEVLASHVSLPGPTKETRFFDLHFDRGVDWYLHHFPNAGSGRPTGEVAPTYFASDKAPDRAASVIPVAKIIFIFRHPVQRLISLYRLKRAYGMLTGSLEDVLEKDHELIASSRYATHLRRWQGSFAPEQLSINLYEQLDDDPQLFVDQLSRFLGISQFSLSVSQTEQVFSSGKMTAPKSYLATRAAIAMADWCKARKLDSVVASVRNSSLIKLFLGGGAPFPDIPVQTMQRISAILLPEIEDLEKILGRDLSKWKTPPTFR